MVQTRDTKQTLWSRLRTQKIKLLINYCCLYLRRVQAQETLYSKSGRQSTYLVNYEYG